MTDEDVAVCYDMSLKEFEHFVVHDLFKVCDFTFASSCHFTFFLPNKVFFLIINFFYFFLTLGNVKVHRSVKVGHRDG